MSTSLMKEYKQPLHLTLLFNKTFLNRNYGSYEIFNPNLGYCINPFEYKIRKGFMF